ncbi:MAG: signal recognition particle protein [Planctomycetes bacterium]|nr:signal recognition particle protein [Planctomycetota bacterium]
MFESITEKLTAAFSRLTSRGKLTEANIQEGLREVRQALLEADVNFKVAKDFIASVTAKAVGKEVIESIRPGQQIVKIVHDELVALMGPTDGYIHWQSSGPTVILMAGLQGSGKTTTCGKLAKYLVKKGKRPLLVAADVQRPAAIQQLQVLGKDLGVPVYAEPSGRPPKICERAIGHAKETDRDVVILDTAGRLHIDAALMQEVKEVADRTKPDEIFLVCDAMTGQDAVNSASAFHAQLPLTGVVLTKLDGDARGGAAMSVKAVTGKPIKFVGLGEKLDEFDEFHPDRMASRILGMGDVITLVEKAQASLEQGKVEKAAEAFMKDQFTFVDFLEMMQQVKKMGKMKDILSMIPGLGSQLKGVDVDDKDIGRIEAIVQSMTITERLHPELFNGSRRKRVAQGSGTSVEAVNQLLRDFQQMRKMMKQMKGMMGGKLGRAKMAQFAKLKGKGGPDSEAFRKFQGGLGGPKR